MPMKAKESKGKKKKMVNPMTAKKGSKVKKS